MVVKRSIIARAWACGLAGCITPSKDVKKIQIDNYPARQAEEYSPEVGCTTRMIVQVWMHYRKP
jgi:hypothetical protein